jgi:coenzyme F420-0:L-glutamate ligase/coenzyme F420-1:gamma-L-glutamate ligase
MVVKIIPVKKLPTINNGDDISDLVCNAAENQGTPIQDNDVIIVTHVVVSRAEGSVINLNSIEPSDFAKSIAAKSEKDPALVEVVLQQAESIVRMRNGCETWINLCQFRC